MDDITQKVIVSVSDFLERLTRAENLNQEQITEANMAVTALNYQLARARYEPESLREIRSQEQQLCMELKQALDQKGEERIVRDWHEQWSAEVGAELTSIVGAERTSALTPKQERETARKLREFLVRYHEKLDPAIGGGTKSTYQGGRGDRGDQSEQGIYITSEKLQSYLNRCVEGYNDVVVTEVEQLMGGYSKETYLVRLQRQDTGEKTCFVIRKDGYGLPTGSSVADEFEVLKEAYAMGIPVPEPLWLEADESIFSAACMAVAFTSGKPAHLQLPQNEAGKRLWTENAARLVAKLHSSTHRPDQDACDNLLAEIDLLEQRVQQRERSPHPGIAFGLQWLREHARDLKGRPVCRTHGDIGFHNMLVDGDTITALLDWEFSHYSDPVEDLEYTRQFMEQLGTWDLFLSVYQQQSGFDYDSAAARFFSVWGEARNAIACLGSLNSLLLPQVKDVALCVAGNVYIPKFEISTLDAIIRSDSHVE